MTDRQRRVLEVLSDQEKPIGAGRVWALAFGESEGYRGRRDAGMTRTLDAMERRGWVDYRYVMGAQQPSRNWRITKSGREALG